MIVSDSFVIADWTDPGTHPGVPIAGLHLHRSDDEAWVVLEGTLGFRVGDEEREVGAGESILVPHGTPHSYWNPNPAPARYLLVMTPRIHRLIEALHGGARGDWARVFEEHDSELLEPPRDVDKILAVDADHIALERELWEALRSRRFDDFQRLLAPRFVSIDDGAVATTDELLAAIEGLWLEEYTLEGLTVTGVSPTVAVVTYRVWERVRTGDQEQERRTIAVSVWTRVGDAWRLALHHETPAEQAPTDPP